MDWGTSAGIGGAFGALANLLAKKDAQSREDEQLAFDRQFRERQLKMSEDLAKERMADKLRADEQWNVLNTPDNTELSPERVTALKAAGLGNFMAPQQSLPSTSRVAVTTAPGIQGNTFTFGKPGTPERQTITTEDSFIEPPSLISQKNEFLPSAPTGKVLSVAPQGEKLRIAEANNATKTAIEGMKAQVRARIAAEKQALEADKAKLLDAYRKGMLGNDQARIQQMAQALEIRGQELEQSERRLDQQWASDYNANITRLATAAMPDMPGMPIAVPQMPPKSFLDNFKDQPQGWTRPTPPATPSGTKLIPQGISKYKYFPNGNVGQPDGQGGFDLVGKWK